MKKPWIMGLLAFGLVSVGFATHTAGTIFNTSAEVVSETEGTLLQGYVNLFVEEGDSVAQTVTLEVGKTYRIKAVGDEEILSDVDLVVRDSFGRILEKDTDKASSLAEVIIEPRTKGNKIEVTAVEMPDSNGYASLLIFEQ